MTTDPLSTGNRPVSRTSLWTAARTELAARRATVAARARLRAELADYAGPADRNDLNARLDDYPDADATEIRALLNRSTAA